MHCPLINLFIFGLVVLMAGCTQLPLRHEIPYTPLPGEKAEIYLYRHNVPDELALPVMIYTRDGERELGVLRPGEFLRVEHVPGTLEITFYPTRELQTPFSQRMQTYSQETPLEGGTRSYYLVRVTKPGAPEVEFSQRPNVVVMTNREGVMIKIRILAVPGEVARGALPVLHPAK
jgi:hypothetical protein